MFRMVIVIGLLGGAAIAKAEQVRMTGEDIKRAMPGALLEIDTPLRISIPVKVHNDGLMSAEAGALGLTLGATKDRGRWWTDGDKLCMKWFRWFDAKVRCMVLHRDGNRVHWAEGSGESGTATITEATPVVVAAAPRPLKKEKRLLTAAVSEPIAPPSEASDPAPATETAAPEATSATQTAAEAATTPEAPATPDASAPSETSATSDTLPALQFAAAALAKAMPKPAPNTPAKLGMGDTAPEAPPPADAARAAEAAPTPPSVEKHPKPKAKLAAVAVSSAPARKGAPAARRAADTPKPVQISFRVSGVIDGDTLNVRSGPSEYHPPVGRIPASGRGVHIVGTCRDTWCPIKHGKLKGWVNRYYLAEDVTLRR